MIHACHWPDCKTEIEPKLLMCRGHWFRLPADLRTLVWANYRPGQEITKTPSREYMAVMDQVLAWARQWEAEHPPKPEAPKNLDLFG